MLQLLQDSQIPQLSQSTLFPVGFTVVGSWGIYFPMAIVKVSIAMKRHHGHGKSYKGRAFNWGSFQFSEGQFIIIVVGHGDVQIGVVLERN